MALAAHFKHGKTISGRGIFLQPRSYPEPETGEMTPATCYAHACTIAEVEVDTETGEVRGARRSRVPMKWAARSTPRMVEQQIVGGAWMGIIARAL